MCESRDQLFAKPLDNLEKFVFDDSVASVFPDMISRSVPGYKTLIDHSGQLAAKFARQKSKCYDLGCSLGATTIALERNLTCEDIQIIAVDNSPAMIARFKRDIEARSEGIPIVVKEADVCEVSINDASVVIMNFTLQFVSPEKRKNLLRSIYDGMMSGGCLIISEKVSMEPFKLDNLMVDAHHQFKRMQGYSDLEVSQKRDSLENVLIPETLEKHFARLQEIGFDLVTTWFQCYNFYSLLAIKQ